MAQFQIVGGPSKFDLMISLFEGNSSNRKVVVFQLMPNNMFGQELKVIINSVGREDGSGDSWLIEAVFAGAIVHRPLLLEGYFSTTSRKGVLKVVKNQK